MRVWATVNHTIIKCISNIFILANRIHTQKHKAQSLTSVSINLKKSVKSLMGEERTKGLLVIVVLSAFPTALWPLAFNKLLVSWNHSDSYSHKSIPFASIYLFTWNVEKTNKRRSQSRVLFGKNSTEHESLNLEILGILFKA